MCGICGAVTTNGSRLNEPALRRMTDVMTHRGPDESGLYLRQGPGMSVGLGHRRLSIIDLTESGRQPLSNEDGTIWLVFNGEIYNYPELRKELVSRGHRFRSNTDSEVIVHLYEEEGFSARAGLRACLPSPSGTRRWARSSCAVIASASSPSSGGVTAAPSSSPRKSNRSSGIPP